MVRRRFSFLAALCLGLGMVSAGPAHASLIPTLIGTPTADGSNPGFFDWDYSVSLSDQSKLTGTNPSGEFITMSTFAGYLPGSASVLSSSGGTWTPSESGPTITFSYGGVAQTGPVDPVLEFRLVSSSNTIQSLASPYNAGTTALNNSPQSNSGFVDGPGVATVPEPSQIAMAACLGLGGAVHWVRRRRRASA